MKTFLAVLLSACVMTISCADKEEVEALDKEFFNMVTTLMSGIQEPGASGIALLITQLLEMGFDKDSPPIEMLESIQHDMQNQPVQKIFEQEQVLEFKGILAEKIAEVYLKVRYITKNGDFNEDIKGILIKEELQNFIDDCFPGIMLPTDGQTLDLGEFLQINKSVSVPDYKVRICAFIALFQERTHDASPAAV